MKSKMTIKNIVIMAAVSIISLFFINMSLAANMGKVNVETANLRETADENSKILILLPMDKEVEVIEKIGNWYKVKTDGITGYLREDLLNITDNTTNTVNTTNITNTTNTVNTTNIINQSSETDNKQVQSTGIEEKEIELGKMYVTESTKLKIVPLINATNIIEVQKNEEVNVIEIINGWVCVETKTTKGWIRKEKLQKTLQEQQTKSEDSASVGTQVQSTVTVQEQAPTVQAVKVNKNLYVKPASINVRADASTTSEVVATLPVNTLVNVTEEINGWSKVNVNGKVGYILSSLLSTQKQETSRSQITARQEKTSNTNNEVSQVQIQSSTSKKGTTIVETAKKYLGCKYSYGGTTPSGFDCSGFTQYVYKLHGISLNRTAAAQANNGVAVDKANLQAGDLVFFSKGKGISHVGIYIGGGNMIHAANAQKGVITSTINSGYYYSCYVCARRIL